MERFSVYIITNKWKSVLYTGVTNDLVRRLAEHYENIGKPETFAGRYRCCYLVYFETSPSIKAAIAREKEIKGWTRAKKEALIIEFNPGWKFLNDDVTG